LAYKESERGKETSLKNKANAQKKTYHHVFLKKHRIEEEIEAISGAKVKVFFAPKQPKAKQTFSEKDKKWAMGMLTQPSQHKMNLPSDYARKISKQSALSKQRAKSGKQIP
jgi:hypothetical protein